MSEHSEISLFDRQWHLLALLNALGGRVGNLDFQKLLFLHCKKLVDPPYEFVPYKFGAFSFTSYADRRKLVERGLLESDDHSWVLTPLGIKMVSGKFKSPDKPSVPAQQHSRLRGDALVAETYRRYPYYAIRSEIAQRLLRDDAETIMRIAAAGKAPNAAALLTIGYEGRTLENYLNELLKSGVTVLCDVRRNPLSRKYGFSKSTLSNGCEGVGVQYEHIPELGISSDQRQNLETQANYDALFVEYERDYLPGHHAALTKIQQWVKDGERVALTCFERLPHQCHRHCVSEAMEQKFGVKFAAKHL
jgi:hypothetical protein